MQNRVWLAAGLILLAAGCNTNVTSVVPTTTSISGRVSDADNDTGLPDWLVFIDTDNNNELSPGDPSTLTDANGDYVFSGLPPGNYTVAQVLQPGWEAADIETRAGRIIGGTDASEGAYPWMVEVEAGSGLCGGTLIRPNWVLTAAHCFFEFGSSTELSVSAAETKVLFGSTKIEKGTPLTVTRIVNHPQYSVGMNGELINDVALLELAEPINSVETIPFATDDSQFSSELTARAIGWGITFDGFTADNLQEVDLPLLRNTECQSQFDSKQLPDTRFLITDVMLCAGGEGGKDACQGDSGGPLFVTTSSGFLQVGITSFGEGCALDGLPGVYARTSAPLLSSFINDTIGTAPTPTPAPTATPTVAPTTTPTATPTTAPTAAPTSAPTATPTTAPTATPTTAPTAAPTTAPTAAPTAAPTIEVAPPVTVAPGESRTVNFRNRFIN